MTEQDDTPNHRFRHLSVRERSPAEITCDRMADIVNMTTSDLYARMLSFALQELSSDGRYEWLKLAECMDNFCSDNNPRNMDYITSFDRKIASFETDHRQMLDDIRKLHCGVCEVSDKLKADFGKLAITDEDVTLMTIGEAHPDFEESLRKRRKMVTQMFFEQLEELTGSLQRRLEGEFAPGDKIGAGAEEYQGPKQASLPHDTSIALAGLYAVLLGGFHEEVTDHYAALEGAVKAKEFEAGLGTVLQALVEYEKSDHAELSHVDRRVAEGYARSIRPALDRVIADLEPKIAAQGENPDTHDLDTLHAAQSLKAIFEEYRKERPLAARDDFLAF